MKNSTTNKIDEQFRNHFSTTTTGVENLDALWNAIEDQRKPSKKRFLPFFFLLGLSFLGVASTSFFLNQKEEINKELEVKKEEVLPLAQSPVSTKKEASNSSLFKKKNEAENKTFVPTKEEKATKPILKTNSVSKAISYVEASQNTSNQNIIVQNKVLEKSPTFAKKEQAKSLVEPAKNKNIPSQKIANSTFRLLATTSPKIVLDKEEVLTKNRKWDKCQVKEKGTFFLNAYGQGTLPFEKITEENSEFVEDMDAYMRAWDDKFDPFLSYMGGLQIGYQFPWKGYLSAGLAYQHFQTKFEENLVVTETITIYDEMAYFYINPEGETVWVADSITQTKIYDRQQSYANNHQMWHIPIQLGYRTEWNNFRVGANVEALLNISKSYDGRFLNPNGSVEEIDTAVDSEYMSTNLGLSLSAGVHLGYQMSDHWEVYLSPRFRFNPNSYLDKSQALNIKRQFAGLRAGVQVHF